MNKKIINSKASTAKPRAKGSTLTASSTPRAHSPEPKAQGSSNKYYVTTPIYYVNDVPHIGHAYTTIAADVLARWHRLKEEDVFFLTGTDEHGLKIERAAKDKGLTPKQLADQLSQAFKDAFKALNIEYSHFLRTTDDYHEKFVDQFIRVVLAKGDIYKGQYEGLYCAGCEAYYVEKDAPDNTCPVHLKKLEFVAEESYFFRLSKYRQRLIQHIEQHPAFLQPESRRNEVLGRLREDLKDLSISRTSFTWGLPWPDDPKHVTYVWFDALTNYLSAVHAPGFPERQKYWPADAQLIGKDILWFHAVIWPAMLWSAGYELPKTVFGHGWWTVDGQKMSKSLGNVVDPVKMTARYGTDQFRYFLLSEIPFGEDGDFSEAKLVSKVNSELADQLGNLVQRVITLVQQNFQGHIPTPGEQTLAENELVSKADVLASCEAALSRFEFNRYLGVVWEFVRYCNKYINDQKPWTLTGDKPRLATVLYHAAESLRIIAHIVWPVIPSHAEAILGQLGLPRGTLQDVRFSLETRGTCKQPTPIFPKLALPKRDLFSILNLRVARIISVAQHPQADKLYVLSVDLGTEKKQLVAGIKPWYAAEQLQGRKIVVVANLKHAKLRGVESQGMLLAAEKDGVVRVLEPDGEPGDAVTVEGAAPNPSQITIEDFQTVAITTKDGTAVSDGRLLKTPKGFVHCDIGDDAKVR